MVTMATQQPRLSESDRLIMEAQGWPYRFEVLGIEEMYLDRYQRTLNERWIASHVEKFFPALLGTLTVSLRPKGKRNYALIDGQHRTELLRRVGLEKAPCVVFYDLSLEQEAELFSLFQRERRAITPYQRFQADLVAKKDEAIAITRVLASEGYELAEDEGPGKIKAVRAVEKIYQEDPARLRQTLRLIRETWKSQPYARNEQMLKGVAFFLTTTEVDEARFIDRLSTVTPSLLQSTVAQLRNARGLTGKSPQVWGEAIEISYRKPAKRR